MTTADHAGPVTGDKGGGGGGGVDGNTFNGPAAFVSGDHATQHVTFVHQWKPAYRIEGFPAAPRPVRARALAEQPSRLLRATHEVVPFTGRGTDLTELARWRDDPAEHLAVRLVHGPGGQGKTRLASHFADLSRRAGWTVWQAIVNETGADPVDARPLRNLGSGVLLVVDYAERWPTSDLHGLLRDPLLHRAGVPVRILLLARPAGVWWEVLHTWIEDHLDAPGGAHALPPLADAPRARADLFRQARNRFADHLGLPPATADGIDTPPDLDTDEDYAQVLTIHIAALAAVDARLHDDVAPTDPARASAYLLKRERGHWAALHKRPHEPLSTPPQAMGRTVLTATLTRPLGRDPHGWDALRRVGLADTEAAADTILDDHRYCYPPPGIDPAGTPPVLEPLYPDRLGEDFLGLSTPAAGPDTPHPVPGAVDDWADRAAERLILGRTGGDPPAPWTRDTLAVLIETARRWPHVATGQLYPLLKAHPELALRAGGTALAALAAITDVRITVLEAIEPHFPPGRHTDLDLGIAAIADRLARHRLANTQDPFAHAVIHDALAVRQFYAGMHAEAVRTAETALQAWRRLTRSDPAYAPRLASCLSNLGVCLSEAGRRAEALTTTEEAVEISRRLATSDPALYEPDLATSLSNLGGDLATAGLRTEALATSQEAVDIYRRLASHNPTAHEPDLARSLTNLGKNLAAAGLRAGALATSQEAVDIYRRLASDNPSAYEPDLASSLTNHGAWLSEAGRPAEALTTTDQVLEIRRRLASNNPTAHEPDLARFLANRGVWLAEAGRRAEALTTTEQAVDIYRRITADNPAAYETEFAASLSNLGSRLSEAGRPADALTATVQVLEIRRRLASNNPTAHEPDLARFLINLGVWLAEVGRGTDALATAEEAVEIYRRLAADNPTAHEPDLAASLCNLGVDLAAAGRRAEALTTADEAVTVLRRLAADNPPAFESLLAGSLSNLGGELSAAGRDSEALAATEEAVEIHRRLTADNSAAHGPDFVRSLTSYAWVRSEARQDLSEALRATGEAVEVYRELLAEVPALYAPPLRAVLRLQVQLLLRLGRLREAEEIHRWLKATDAGRHP
ncbi:tetratricopeptide repeat protein [Streptomyces sp. NPDC101206]|uniref:tetratricopeptide repeat protein n=1 Tax=Streptomyces sp. NPDC101206 TaxID=3366128 RepID=UPI0038228C59